MGFRVDFNSLDSVHTQITNQSESWKGAITEVQLALSKLIETSNMSGKGADAIRGYLQMVHVPLAQLIQQLVQDHSDKVTLYSNDYHQNIDTGFDAVIDEDELHDIMQALVSMKNAVVEIDDCVRDELLKISDIFKYSLRSAADAVNAINKAHNLCSNLCDAVNSLENIHYNSDFQVSGVLIPELVGQLNDYLNKSKSFKASYDPNSPENMAAYGRLTKLSAAVQIVLDGQAEAVEAAIEQHEAREELEKRLETVKWQKILVSAAVIVVSAVVIAALPVSGPLVVGAVSGLSSAITSGANTAMVLYAVDGELSAEDIEKANMEGLKGFATGFVTGAVGGVVGKSMSSLTKGIPALHSANHMVNVATHVAVGSATEVVSGVATRAAGEVIDQMTDDEAGFNWSEVGSKAFDIGEIAKDAVLGGVDGYIDGHKVDYSESMNSDYEQGYITEADAELGYDTTDMDPEKTFTDHLKDYTFKKKDDYEFSLDEVLSPDDYDDDVYDAIKGTNKVLESAHDVADKAGVYNDDWLRDGALKSDNDTLYDARKKAEKSNANDNSDSW